jgi:hypothetical protein
MPWSHMGWEEVQLLLILNLGTRWGWVVSVAPLPRFTPGGRTPGTNWIGDWVGPRAGLDAGARRKIPCPCQGSNPGRPARSQTLYCLSYRGSSTMKSTLLKHILLNNDLGWQCISDLRDMSWRTHLECQCTPKSRPFQLLISTNDGISHRFQQLLTLVFSVK